MNLKKYITINYKIYNYIDKIEMFELNIYKSINNESNGTNEKRKIRI